MIEEIHVTGERILKLRRKLKAREGIPGYRKNCEMIRQEIARLERSTIPDQAQIDSAWKAAEEAREKEILTTSPSDQDAPAVASNSKEDLSGVK